MNLKRKFVHIISISFALLIGRISPVSISIICFCALLVNVFIMPKISKGQLEYDIDLKQGYSIGMIMYPLVLFFASIIFIENQVLMAVAWGALAFGDASAGVVGGYLGKNHKLAWNKKKSWAGLIGFWVLGSAFTYGFLFLLPDKMHSSLSQQQWAVVVIAAVVAGGIAETFNEILDDNLAIVVVSGFVARVLFGFYTQLSPPYFTLPPNATLACLLIAGALGLAFGFKKLDIWGVIAGGIVAFSIFLGANLEGLYLLFAFLLLGFGATAYKKSRPSYRNTYKSNRSAANVWANGGMAAIFGLMAWVFKLDATTYIVCMGCVLAAATADTLSSELGTIFGKNPIKITTFAPAQVGEDGGISHEGTMAAAAGALCIAIVYCIFIDTNPDHWLLIIILGFLGSIIDSFLGAVFQKQKYLNNHTVNFLSTLVVGIIALLR